MTLDEIAQKISECHRCVLGDTRNLTVPGEGPASAPIMFIGEAPGAREDETGRPFIGRSGNLLTSVLEEAGIKRSECFVTSPLKCRPPQNRLPKKAELAMCKPWLEAQIKAINPKVICLLGNFACKTMLGKTGITKLHGTFEERNGQMFFLTYHPAAIIRGMIRRDVYLEDMKLLSKTVFDK